MKLFTVVLTVLYLIQIIRWTIILIRNKTYVIDRWDISALIALWASTLMTTVAQYGR